MKNLLLLFFPVLAFSQSPSGFSHSWYSQFEKEKHFISSDHHTSIKPFSFSQFDLNTNYIDSFSIASKGINKFLNHHLFSYSSDELELIINPLFHFELGKSDSANRYVNTRAFEARGKIGSRVSFYTSFYENQAIFPNYLEDEIVANNFVVPGQGQSKWGNHDIDHDFDFAMSNGLVNYQASKQINFQFGHGKNFFGDGYRSLLLSDNAFNYPYFKITTKAWKFNYVNLFSVLQDLRPEFELNNTFRKKYSTTHFLSINLTKRLNIGVFETILWEQSESGRGFDVNYLNPIIFYRPVEFSLGSQSGNALLGLNFKYKVSDLTHLYGQFILDEFKFDEIVAGNGWWANKFGYQIGIKCFDLFGVKNLKFQSEYNFARPFIYSHRNPLQSVTHYGQSLTHPLGASFSENVSIIRYNHKRWMADLKIVVAQHGDDIPGDSINYGNDVLISYYQGGRNEYDNQVAQGNTTDLKIIDLRLAYLVNPNTNMKIELGLSNRSSTSLYKPSSKTNYIFLSFKTDINNYYYDF